MKEINRIISDWIWQLPQNLLGILWRKVQKDDIITSITNNDIRLVKSETYLMKSMKGAITLGKYVFVSQNFQDLEGTIKHECGHVKQSKILGPLYLIVIGIPSIIHAWLNKYIGCDKEKGYAHFYTEKWANKLMGL